MALLPYKSINKYCAVSFQIDCPFESETQNCNYLHAMWSLDCHNWSKILRIVMFQCNFVHNSCKNKPMIVVFGELSILSFPSLGNEMCKLKKQQKSWCLVNTATYSWCNGKFMNEILLFEFSSNLSIAISLLSSKH